MFTNAPPLTHVEISRPRDTTELNNDGMMKLDDVHYQSRIYQFFETDLINDDSSFCSPCNDVAMLGNYEAVSKFVKVMPRILWLLLSGHSVANRVDVHDVLYARTFGSVTF